MKQITKYAIAYLVGATLAGTTVFGIKQKEVGKLERELSSATAKIERTEKDRDNYRRQLIQNGNPEGWNLNGDGMFSCWYERLNGDAIGNCWTEYLKIKAE